jgi:hypothetical protein
MTTTPGSKVERDTRSTSRFPFSRAAAIALAFKLPLVAVGVSNQDGIAGIVPPTEVGPGLFLSLAFLASSIIYLLRRHWFGAASAVVYALYTVIGGALLVANFPFWAGAVLLTSLAALGFVLMAFRRREFSQTT